jgi:glycosyltransferase involved in cell wall biosynthesis
MNAGGLSIAGGSKTKLIVLEDDMAQDAANVIKNGSSLGKGRKPLAGPIKVAMHVLGAASTDPRVLREATALVEAGYEVSIVDIDEEGSHPRDEELQGVSLKHVLMPPAFFSTRFDKSALTRVTKMFVRTTTRLLQTNADIYHGHEVSGLLPCYIAAVLRRKPVIFDAHEMPLFERPLSELGRSRRFLRGLLVILLKYIVPRCAGVITVSPPIVDELRTRYGLAEVTLIRNIPEFRDVKRSDRLRTLLDLKPETRIVLYQGYLQPNRGLDKLIRAAALLEPNTVIVLMGKNRKTTQAQLEALIASEGVEDRVKIIPPVPYKDLLDWTSSADVGVNVASPDYSLNVQYFLPNKLFEYIMSGLPVLTSSLRAMVEVVKRYDVGQVFPSLEPADIAEAINKILTDPAALARMRQNALEAARNELHWEKEQTKLIELYQSILPMSTSDDAKEGVEQKASVEQLTK